MAENISAAFADLQKIKHKLSGKEKGDMGEKILLKIARKVQDRNGGIIFHSFKYHYVKGIPGNILKQSDGSLIEKSDAAFQDEIDVLYVHTNCIIPIECKAYGAKKGIMEFRDDWWTYGGHIDKYPMAQEEKHCRHLYHNIYEFLPEGNPAYIKPLTVFIDRCEIDDNRSDIIVKAQPISVLNTAAKILSSYINKSDLDSRINMTLLMKKLKSIQTSGTEYK